MAMTINTNVVSINAQRNLGLSGSALGVSMQRLSSGLRVNSAKDDAAGLAIAERMNAQAKGLSVASRNANDGISLAQTAEGALGKVGDMLQRMRELAVQSSNATNSASDREALQAEVDQLRSEIDRVAKTSSFNGKKLLDGSFAGGVFQVGAGAGDNITVGSLADATAAKLSNISYSVGTIAANTATGTALGAMTLTISGGKILAANAVDIEVAEASSSTERQGQIVQAINSKTADTGVTAFLQDDGSIKLMSNDVSADSTFALVGAANTTVDADSTAALAAVAGSGFTNATAAEQVGISSLSVSTQANAWVALKKIDSALDQVNSARATLGALQTRFEKSIENIDIMNENISAARGRIVDADFAAETASLSRTQILQQAGVAMVSQANQIPQNVLQLLQ